MKLNPGTPLSAAALGFRLWRLIPRLRYRWITPGGPPGDEKTVPPFTMKRMKLNQWSAGRQTGFILNSTASFQLAILFLKLEA